MENKQPIWEIINEIGNIQDFYHKSLSKQSNGLLRGHCALHDNSDSPSFVLNPISQEWYCHDISCGKGGKVIDFYMHINNIDRKTAIFELAQHYNIPSENLDKEQIETKVKIDDIYIDFMEKCHENMRNNKYYFLTKLTRAFTNETIDKYKVGLIDNSIKEYMETKYSDELLINAGFKRDKDKEGNDWIHWIMGKRIVFCYLDRNNKPYSFIYRRIDELGKESYPTSSKYSKQARTIYSIERPFGLNTLEKYSDKPLIISEGITDAMSVDQAKYPTLSAVDPWFKDEELERLPNYCKRFPKTIVIFDNEEGKKDKEGNLINPGLKGAEKTVKILLSKGINAYLGIIPKSKDIEKIDLDEYLKPDLTNVNNKEVDKIIEQSLNEQTEKLDKLVSNSVEGFNYFINNIDKNSSKNDIEKIFELLPNDNDILQDEIFEKLKKQKKVGKRAIQKQYKTYLNKLNKKNTNKNKANINRDLKNKDFEKAIENFTHDTKTEDILEILNNLVELNPSNIDKLLFRIAKNTGNDITWIKEQIEIIIIEKIAKENKIQLDLATITRKEIQFLASHLDLNRPGSITGFFLALEENCKLGRESICLTLLPNIEEFMNKIIDKYHMFIIAKFNIIYIYDKSGVYIKKEEKPEDVINSLINNELPFYIKQIVGDVYFNRRITTISKEIINRSKINENELDFSIINIKNGILKLSDIKKRKWILYPHSFEYKTIIQFNVEFNPFIKWPKKEKKILYNIFKERLGPDQLIQLLKLYGISLIGKPDDFKIITIIVGPSGTGKSLILLITLETIVKSENIAIADLHKLCSKKENYESGLLLGKLININGDIGMGYLEDPSEINRLTEAFLNINKKYGYKGEIMNRISHFYACNRLPIIIDLDRTDIMRRIHVIAIRGQPIPENKRDFNFFNKLIKNNPNELNFIFNLMLHYLSIVLQKRNLDLPPITERREKYLKFSKPLLSFITDYIIKHETNKETKPSETWLIDRDYFLEIYNKYRLELNYESYLTTHKLTSENNGLAKFIKLYTRKKDSKRVYLGVQFNDLAKEHFRINIDEEIKNKNIYKPKEKEPTWNLTQHLTPTKRINENRQRDKIYDKLMEILEENEDKLVYYDSVIQVITTEVIDNKNLIIDTIDQLLNEKKLFINSENQLYRKENNENDENIKVDNIETI